MRGQSASGGGTLTYCTEAAYWGGPKSARRLRVSGEDWYHARSERLLAGVSIFMRWQPSNGAWNICGMRRGTCVWMRPRAVASGRIGHR